MIKQIEGFTLVELVIVVIILGILAAISVPKFIDLASDAKSAATTSIAASLTSANAINYISRKVSISNGVPVSNCTSIANALQNGLSSGYTITSLAVSTDVTSSCTLTGPSSTTAIFNATGIS